MKKKKEKKYNLIRIKYGNKRHSKKWKLRNKQNKLNIRVAKKNKEKQRKKPSISIIAPRNFSFIRNTNEVLLYFKKAKKLIREKENITLDISNVDYLTSDAVILMVSNIHNPNFANKSIISGNAPRKPDLYKLFTESGFYEYVNTNGHFSFKNDGLLHKEVHRIVDPEVAKRAFLIGIEHVFGYKKSFDPLYEILVECMSNTKSHADLQSEGVCKWWLYTHNFSGEKITAYSFLDLGVGIFKSAVLQNYLKNKLKGTVVYKNINLVDNLLEGKIQSRVDIDNEIRGKGIPQIVRHARLPEFREFIIISNDVKINVKTGEREQLDNELKGTFLYWELYKK